MVLLVPMKRLVLERYCSTLASASATLVRSLSISPESHCAGGARLLLLGGLLQDQIALGDRVGDLRGKLGILRFELDRDDARFLDLEGRQPVVIALEHPLLGRHAHRVLDEPDEAENGPDQRRAAQHRIEFRPLAELELLDDLAREIARQDELDLAGHRLLVDGGAALEASSPRPAAGRCSRGSRSARALPTCIAA